MWIDWPPLWIGVANVLVIPTVHLFVSWVATCLPDGWFVRKDPGSGVARWEGPFYERCLLIRLWKDSLPDAAPWFGGVSKRRLESRDPAYLRTFVLEARRGEWAHWVQLLLVNVCVLWTPLPWAWVIVGYSLFSNLPCIFNQRYTRLRLRRVLGRGVRG